MDSIIEMSKLVFLMIFVSSLGAQGWIAFLDITGYFTKQLERFRPLPVQDKFSRFAIIIGALVLSIY
ncbi:hypothetical protein [Sulfurimonas sp.]|jgi:hypothetical protein|uniref:hypothetical protein n=2 Tax=Sulfurimonas TaxID=202746 RepID=UPI0025FC1D03|nr:hypothetical protein [Sulfurimonas sp.]